MLAVLLLAAKFGVPVCPHAGGVGLCEYVQHLAMFDYIAVSGSLDGRVVEYVDHLHEHFVDPVVGSATAGTSSPEAPGYSITMQSRVARAVRVPEWLGWTAWTARGPMVGGRARDRPARRQACA